MRKKKGTLKTAVIMVGLVFTAIIILGIWSSSWGKTKEKYEENMGIIDVSKELPDSKVKIDPEIEISFQKFAEILQDSKGKACLVVHNGFPNQLKKEGVTVARHGDSTYIQLFNEIGQLAASATIEKTPCVVHARNFYDNCIKGTDCNNENNIIEIESYIKKKHIFFDDKKAGLKDQDLMFQLDDNHVCFFPTKGGSLLGRCDAGEYTLDDDCMLEIFAKIGICSGDTKTLFFNNQFYGLKKDWQLVSGIWLYKGTDTRVPYYFSDIGIKPYHFKAILQIEVQTPPEGKTGVFYSKNLDEPGNYYGKKEDWEYFDKTWFIFGTEGWKYIGTEEVPEKFKTKGISNMDKYNVFGPPLRG